MTDALFVQSLFLSIMLISASLEDIPFEQLDMLKYIETGDTSDEATRHLDAEIEGLKATIRQLENSSKINS